MYLRRFVAGYMSECGGGAEAVTHPKLPGLIFRVTQFHLETSSNDLEICALYTVVQFEIGRFRPLEQFSTTAVNVRD